MDDVLNVAPPVERSRGRAAATIAASLAFERIARRYGETHALRDVSLAVAPGEVVCLLGPSGCGKTTLLRIAAGIEKPTRGRVLIDGFEVAGEDRFVPPERRNVGLVFQDFALFPHLSIVQNVAFGLKSLPRREARRVAMGLLTRVGLTDKAHVYPATLSGGEQQRVALARAIAPRPGVLLMDEPFSGLDVQLRSAMQQETLAILRETHATSIIVTHDPEEAMRLADRIAVLLAGSILQVGTAEELYHRPADIFIARLFSSLNELAGRVRAGRIETPFGSMPSGGIAEGASVIVGLREQQVGILEAGKGRAARIVDRKLIGDSITLDLAVEGLDLPLRARVPAPTELERGQEVGIGVDPATMLAFPAASR